MAKAEAKAAVLLIASMLIALSVAQLSSKGGNCPLRNTVSKCTPTCTSDSQCGFDQKCCPNKCGSKSCAQPSAVKTRSARSPKISRVPPVCGGLKCERYENCIIVDYKTNRRKCVRA